MKNEDRVKCETWGNKKRRIEADFSDVFTTGLGESVVKKHEILHEKLRIAKKNNDQFSTTSQHRNECDGCKSRG